MKVLLKDTDPRLITAKVSQQVGGEQKPYEFVVTHDDYSESFVLLSREYGSESKNEFDLVWKGNVVAVLSTLTDLVGDALTEQFGFGNADPAAGN